MFIVLLKNKTTGLFLCENKISTLSMYFDARLRSAVLPYLQTFAEAEEAETEEMFLDAENELLDRLSSVPTQSGIASPEFNHAAS